MRNRVAQTDWRTYLDATLFPLKIYTVLAAIWIIAWHARLPSHPADTTGWLWLDFSVFAGSVAWGYLLSGLILLAGGLIQVGYCSRRAWIWSLSFAATALVIGIGMECFAGGIHGAIEASVNVVP